MVFDSVCLVDMIVLGMFRADIEWKKSFEIFSGEVSTKSSPKMAHNDKYCLVIPKKAWISLFLHF